MGVFLLGGLCQVFEEPFAVVSVSDILLNFEVQVSLYDVEGGGDSGLVVSLLFTGSGEVNNDGTGLDGFSSGKDVGELEVRLGGEGLKYDVGNPPQNRYVEDIWRDLFLGHLEEAGFIEQDLDELSLGGGE